MHKYIFLIFIILLLLLYGCSTNNNSWLIRAFGKSCWPFTNGQEFYEISPCKDACRTWLKSHNEYTKRGKIWYFRNINHWSTPSGRNERYHSIVWYVDENGIKRYYDPLLGKHITLTPTEQNSIVYEGM